jgi:branched-chain amino acid transport system ATP-binding protein
MTVPLLEVQRLDAAYGHIQALRGVSLRVEPGEVVAVLGPNGAGKSTLLRAIVGLLPATGQILLEGASIIGAGPRRALESGVTLVPEGRGVLGPLTVLENLELGGYLRWAREPRPDIQKDLDFVYRLFPILRERRRQRAGSLSGGEQQMLALGRALMSRPRLLLLDEPSLGLAPLLVQEVFHIIRQLNGQGVTILLVEQNAAAALEIAHYGYVLENGRLALAGTGEELLAHPRLQEAYLGDGPDGL